MLESFYISKSRIRQDLLALFFTNPRARYYLREMQRILGYSAGSIRRELLKFKNDGFLFNEKVGNLLYYKINSEHPLFNELKAIVSKTIGIEGNIRKKISSIKSINYAFIYGSFAANREKASIYL